MKALDFFELHVENKCESTAGTSRGRYSVGSGIGTAAHGIPQNRESRRVARGQGPGLKRDLGRSEYRGVTTGPSSEVGYGEGHAARGTVAARQFVARRKNDGKTRPLSFFALDVDGTAVQFDQGPNDVKSEPRRLFTSRRLGRESLQLPEVVLPSGGGKPGAPVGIGTGGFIPTRFNRIPPRR